MAKKQSLEKKKMIRAQSLQKKEDRAKEEAALLNRCLGLLGVLVAAEIYFLLCYRFFIQGTMQTLVTMSNVIAVVGWVGLAVAAVGLVFALVRRGQKGAQWGAWLVILGLVLFGGGRLMLAIYPEGTTVMCVAVPLVALAGFVYYLYQREFFFSGLGVGLAVGGMWLAHRAVGSAVWGRQYVAIEAVLLAAVVVLLILAVAIGKNGGKWGKGDAARTVFSGTTNYSLVYGALAAAAAAIVLGIIAPACALYLLWAGIALLFVLAVYYTMHLM